MYKLTATGVIKNGTMHIPADPRNSDYQDFLRWQADGGVPTPADPPPNPRIKVIVSRLDQIDRDSIRALRAKAAGRGNQNDDNKLTTLEDEAIALRAELATLTAV